MALRPQPSTGGPNKFAKSVLVTLSFLFLKETLKLLTTLTKYVLEQFSQMHPTAKVLIAQGQGATGRIVLFVSSQ